MVYRLDLFARKGRSYDAIPPTSMALKEHAKCAAYQAGIIWGQATVSNPESISPANWGWMQKGERWQILWTTLQPVAASCQELTKCACKKAVTGDTNAIVQGSLAQYSAALCVSSSITVDILNTCLHLCYTVLYF